MAKRKKHHAPRRRRRVGASSGMSGLLMTAVGLVGGNVVAGLVGKMIPTLDPKISGAVFLGGGLFASTKVSSPLLKGVTLGVAAKGANSLATSFGIINGIGSIPLIGYRNTPKLQNSVGNVMRNPIGAVKSRKDLNAIGALYDN